MIGKIKKKSSGVFSEKHQVKTGRDKTNWLSEQCVRHLDRDIHLDSHVFEGVSSKKATVGKKIEN